MSLDNPGPPGFKYHGSIGAGADGNWTYQPTLEQRAEVLRGAERDEARRLTKLLKRPHLSPKRKAKLERRLWKYLLPVADSTRQMVREVLSGTSPAGGEA